MATSNEKQVTDNFDLACYLLNKLLKYSVVLLILTIFHLLLSQKVINNKGRPTKEKNH